MAFDDYYTKEFRSGYIAAALNKTSITGWKVISRDNPAANYPSDFDIIKVKFLNSNVIIHSKLSIMFNRFNKIVVLFIKS